MMKLKKKRAVEVVSSVFILFFELFVFIFCVMYGC